MASTTPQGFWVGVDFGTTFTCVAFAHSSSPEEVKLVHTWPNGSTVSENADQVPSVVYYLDPVTRTKCWGYATPPPRGRRAAGPEAERLQWFKLLLQTAPGKQSQFGAPGNPAAKAAAALAAIDITPTAVVADFLSEVREKTLESIRQTYDFGWVSEAKVSYVLTVPAIWTDAAKNQMILAAEAAGFGTHRVGFHLVSEPEAAAAHTLKTVPTHNLKLGDNFIICDAGGGTVDLISYKITQVQPLKVKESVGGTGDMCGSVYLDAGFFRYIRRTLGNYTVDAMKPRSRAEMMRTWEEKVKLKFNGKSESDEWEITVPGVADSEEWNVEDGFHYMKDAAVEDIFAPIVERVVQLVKQQVRQLMKRGETVAAIILVGGFGSSQYLARILQNLQFDAGKIAVIQPPQARTAIARGALQCGLEGPMVTVRRARFHYGCTFNCTYQSGTDSEHQKYWCPRHERFMVREKMNWYIKKDDEIGGNLSVSLNLVRLVPIPTDSTRPALTFSDRLYYCAQDDAPDFRWRSPEAVRPICTITSNLSGVPVSKFKRQNNNKGVEFYRVSFVLRLSVEREVMKFEMLFDGESCGLATAKFDER